MSDWALLDPADEDALHKSRLLNVEEKPYKRITKHLLPKCPLNTFPILHPIPSSNPTDEVSDTTAENEKTLSSRLDFRSTLLLDFAAFDASLARMQFTFNSNASERERYTLEKDRILALAQQVRANTTELRAQLEEAQRTLARKKTYDELAEKITSNRLLRPREDQRINLDKLEAEIAELEQESREYGQTWAERRDQFGRIIEEGVALRRLIRDEKEEVERREGMEEREEGEDGDMAGKEGRLSGGATPRVEAGTGTVTPSFGEEGPETKGGLAIGIAKRLAGGRSPLREAERVEEVEAAKEDAGEDVDMTEDGEVSVELEGMADPVAGVVAEEEEGEEQMDIS